MGPAPGNGRPGTRAPRSRLERIAADRRSIPAALAAACFVAAFVQRPGKTAYDSRVELSLNPSQFLGQLADVWNSTGDLGHIQSGQFVGYLAPVAPWYAFWDWLGLPTWIAQRLWLGLLLAVAAWGVVRLMDVLYDERRGWTHLTAGLLYVANPYVVLNLSRSTATLLAYAALPWFLLAVQRGLRAPADWRWPLAIAVLMALGGGGVNAAVLIWVPAAGAALAFYELVLRRVTGRALVAFGWRAVLCSVVACMWWMVPAVLQGRYGGDFLSYTEQPSAIWATPSMSESLRLLGFWLMYIAVASDPVMAVAPTYLFNLAVITAGFAVPLVAFGCLRWTRRWEYGPFFGLLACAGLVFMALGFPDGAPMREALEDVYAAFEPIRFIRTTYKAAPLVALSFACLAGAGVAALLRVLNAARGHPRGVRLPAWAPAIALVIPLLCALPLVEGRAIDPGRAYDEVPRYWHDAVADAEQTTPRDHRVMILPGSLFAWYRFGETVTSVAPALTERPVLVREVTRYADQRASELQTYVDDLVQQGRLVPDQLGPLLQLMGVGQLLIQADQRVPQSGALEPARVEQALLGQDLGSTLGAYGETHDYAPFPGWGGATVALPDLRRVEGPGATAPGVVRVHSRDRPVVLDGDGEGITELAAVGRLDPARALFYAGDLGRGELARLVEDGAELVITDSNRRRPVDPNRMRENRAWTLDAGHDIPLDWPPSGLFAERGAAARTVATYSGLDWLRSPLDRRFAIYPQYRPYAALDGDYRTAWLPGAGVENKNSYFELKLRHPRSIDALRVLPHRDQIGRTQVVAISVNGRAERRFEVGSGWNRLALGEPHVSTLRVRVDGAPAGFVDVNGGLTELEIPGLRVRESLRTPLLLARGTRSLDVSSSSLRVLLQRTTADFPYRAGMIVGDPQAGDPLDMVDAEPGIERTVELPDRRRFRLAGWASARPDADVAIDRLLGMPHGWRFRSSPRFEGVPRNRASSAFDRNRRTAWVGDWSEEHRAWLAWRSPKRVTIRRMRLLPGPGVHASPAGVELIAGGRHYGPLRVGPRGEVRLPRKLHARTVAIWVTALRPPATPAQPLRSVAIGEIRVAGLRTPRTRRSGRFLSDCGELTVTAGRSRATARVTGSVAALDAGRPVRLVSCGRRGRLLLPPSRAELSASPGAVFRPDHLELSSPAPDEPVGARASPPRVRDPGESEAGRRDGVRLALGGPAWLVLAESYSSAWRAWCRDAAGRERPLGAPIPADGFGNGWQVGPGCREARFEWAHQGLADAGYLISATGAGLAAMVLAGWAVLRLRRRRSACGARDESPAPPPQPPTDDRLATRDPVVRFPWPKALAIALAVGFLTGPLFALRAGLALALIAFVLLQVGISARRLVALGSLALIALPAWYWIEHARWFGTVSFVYAMNQLTAHWLAVFAVSCFAAASAISAARLRRQGRR